MHNAEIEELFPKRAESRHKSSYKTFYIFRPTASEISTVHIVFIKPKTEIYWKTIKKTIDSRLFEFMFKKMQK